VLQIAKAYNKLTWNNQSRSHRMAEQCSKPPTARYIESACGPTGRSTCCKFKNMDPRPRSMAQGPWTPVRIQKNRSLCDLRGSICTGKNDGRSQNIRVLSGSCGPIVRSTPPKYEGQKRFQGPLRVSSNLVDQIPSNILWTGLVQSMENSVDLGPGPVHRRLAVLHCAVFTEPSI
jgi:hypothetical protein